MDQVIADSIARRELPGTVVLAARRGGIVWQKQVSYRDILAKGLPREEQDEAVRSSMEKVLHTAATAIARGKLP